MSKKPCKKPTDSKSVAKTPQIPHGIPAAPAAKPEPAPAPAAWSAKDYFGVDRTLDRAAVAAEYGKFLQEQEMDTKGALWRLCLAHNIYFNDIIATKLIKEKGEPAMPGAYLDAVLSQDASNPAKGHTLDSQLSPDAFQNVYGERMATDLLDEQGKKNLGEIMATYHRDPFVDVDMKKRPKLYAALAEMLDPSFEHDLTKQLAAQNVVYDYQDIDDYKARASRITSKSTVSEEEREELKDWNEMIKNKQDSINKVCKENGLVSSQSKNGAADQTLTAMMKQMKDSDYDPDTTNYFDVKRSAGVKWVMDRSWQSIFDQCRFTDADAVRVMKQQGDDNKKLQEENDKLREKVRMALAEVKKGKLLAELERKYKEKGIPDEDVEELLKREYNL